jgi:hypothetical protein
MLTHDGRDINRNHERQSCLRENSLLAVFERLFGEFDHAGWSQKVTRSGCIYRAAITNRSFGFPQGNEESSEAQCDTISAFADRLLRLLSRVISKPGRPGLSLYPFKIRPERGFESTTIGVWRRGRYPRKSRPYPTNRSHIKPLLSYPATPCEDSKNKVLCSVQSDSLPHLG